MAQLRPGDAESESTSVRRDDGNLAGRKEAQARSTIGYGVRAFSQQTPGCRARSQGDPVLFLSNPPGVSPETRRRLMLDSLARLNERTLNQIGDPETLSRIAQYEMAFPHANLGAGTDRHLRRTATRAGYVRSRRHQAGYLRGQLPVERAEWPNETCDSCRFSIAAGTSTETLPETCPINVRTSTNPPGALIQDLKQRGPAGRYAGCLGGEFGRTIYCQGDL